MLVRNRIQDRTVQKQPASRVDDEGSDWHAHSRDLEMHKQISHLASKSFKMKLLVGGIGNAQFRIAGYPRSKYFDGVAYLAIKVSNSVLDGMGNKARRHVINQISATASDENRIECISIQ